MSRTCSWPALAAGGLFAAALWLALDAGNGSAAALLTGAALLGLGLAAWERGSGGAREVALVAAIGAAAAAGRVLFGPVPSVKPVTVIVACAGIALGARAGAAVAAVAVLVSNGFLGHGPWTPWQILGWGLVGVSAAGLAPLLRKRAALIVFCAAWGLLYGALLNFWDMLAFAPQASLETWLALETRGLPFDVAHAAGNVVMAAVAGPVLIRMFDRFGRRLHHEIVDAEPAGDVARL